jgi:hypothetical protein
VSSSRTLRRQAQAEATLRTAPQASVLREMLIQAMSDRDVAIKAATGSAHGVTAAVAKAGPSLKHVYSDAINQAHGTSATVDATLSSMGAVAGPYQAAMARERGTGRIVSRSPSRPRSPNCRTAASKPPPAGRRPPMRR